LPVRHEELLSVIGPVHRVVAGYTPITDEHRSQALSSLVSLSSPVDVRKPGLRRAAPNRPRGAIVRLLDVLALIDEPEARLRHRLQVLCLLIELSSAKRLLLPAFNHLLALAHKLGCLLGSVSHALNLVIGD